MAQMQQIQFKITKGMNQDTDIQEFSQNQAFRLFNIKTQTADSSVSGNLTNEKGNSIIYGSDGNQINIFGDIVGMIQCTDSMVVLFVCVDSAAYNTTINVIYRLTYEEQSDTINVRILAKGDFNIHKFVENGGDVKEVEISGLFVYENSNIQKIYWVDGINQLRFINIADSNPLFQSDKSPHGYIEDVELLNSKPSFKVDHHIEVIRNSGGGSFTSGVIQYAFTYFNKYGAETNIVDITPLYYVGEINRGVAADKVVGCSFTVNIYNPDTSFEYIRVYSIQRTSLNGTPIVKVVGDIKI